ncbi:hypothetical protein GCM10009801_40310 [Streptomyces albiaxialis]|uniref:Asp23/Gls24 family envelope stress response protein n=1 Tax=Streptomyces albiaxialis TaxID=329523 RepID=A0ABN2W5R4_9ACTN
MTEGVVPAAGRGETRIADRVVAKVAAQAAREALRQDGRSTALPGGAVARPRATVAVREQSARVRVALELAYPSDIGAQCGAVRRQVTERVKELVGMEVPHVAVDVERLHSAHLKGGAPGRVT